MSPRPWSEVRKKALDHVAKATELLIEAKGDRVLELQTEIRVTRRFIEWFEGGAKDDLIGEAPTDTVSNKATPGGY